MRWVSQGWSRWIGAAFLVSSGCGPETGTDPTSSTESGSSTGPSAASSEAIEPDSSGGSGSPETGSSGDLPTGWCLVGEPFELVPDVRRFEVGDVDGDGHREAWAFVDANTDDETRAHRIVPGDPPSADAAIDRLGRFEAFADIEGDGRDDMIVAMPDGSFHWYAAQGGGALADVASLLTLELELGERTWLDADGDGASDVLGRPSDQDRVAFLHGAADGAMTSAGGVELNADRFEMGYTAMAAEDAPGQLVLLLTTPTLGFGSDADRPVGVRASADDLVVLAEAPAALDDLTLLHVADLDRDGTPDALATRSIGSSTLTAVGWLRGSESGYDMEPVADVDDTRSVVVGDLDGDGELDLLSIGAALSLQLGTGAGSFAASEPCTGEIVGESSARTPFDLDADGRQEIVVAVGGGHFVHHLEPC